MKKMDLSQQITLVLSLLAILSSVLSIFINADLKERVDVRFTQYNLTNEEQNKILKNLFELEDFLDELIARYGVEANDLSKKITMEEKLQVNKFLSEVNLGLSKVYIVMDDKKYKMIADSWPLEPKKLSELRNHLTILMRKTQYPETSFDKVEDIKIIYKFE